jgi:hypothetical protein
MPTLLKLESELSLVKQENIKLSDTVRRLNSQIEASHRENRQHSQHQKAPRGDVGGPHSSTEDFSNQSRPPNRNIFNASHPPQASELDIVSPNRESSRTSYMECPNCHAFSDQIAD